MYILEYKNMTSVSREFSSTHFDFGAGFLFKHAALSNPKRKENPLQPSFVPHFLPLGLTYMVF